MARKGVYNDWIEGKGLETVCQWARLGLSDKQIAHNMGISETAYYEWKNRFPAFAEAIKKAKGVPDLELENAMFDLATGRTYVEETKSILDPNTGKLLRIERVKKQVPPNPTVQIFLAKNRMPERYKDRAPVQDTASEEKQTVSIYIPDNGRGER